MKSNFQLNNERRKKQRKKKERFIGSLGWIIITLIGIGGTYYVYRFANL